VVQGRVQTFVNVRIGGPVDVILARAVAMRAELIVVTSRACSGRKNELQRCAAEKISRRAPCPVLTIPEKCGEAIAYSEDFFPESGTVLMPVDFSTAAEQASAPAVGIATQCRAKLLLAHGTETIHLDEDEIHERLRSWPERILNQPVECQTAIWPGGHSLYAILSEALRSEARVIVLPVRSQPWTRKLRAGSITDGVLRQAPCPVLSINETISLTN
jgi:nucleotide-binding universal stress UspA family protein